MAAFYVSIVWFFGLDTLAHDYPLFSLHVCSIHLQDLVCILSTCPFISHLDSSSHLQGFDFGCSSLSHDHIGIQGSFFCLQDLLGYIPIVPWPLTGRHWQLFVSQKLDFVLNSLAHDYPLHGRHDGSICLQVLLRSNSLANDYSVAAMASPVYL
jgi:hypothetical protein